MLQFLRYALWLLARLVLLLRYRLHVEGLEELRDRPGSFLVLPNHPAFVDPLLVLRVLWPRLRPRPMVYAANFHHPLLYPFMKLIDAVEVPDLEQANLPARAQAEQAVAAVIEGLKAGHNHILWPSGMLRRTALERLGAA